MVIGILRVFSFGDILRKDAGSNEEGYKQKLFSFRLLSMSEKTDTTIGTLLPGGKTYDERRPLKMHVHR